MTKPKPGRATLLARDQIILDPRLQVRAKGLDHEHAEDIGEYLKKKGGKIPRVPVFKTSQAAMGTKQQYYAVGGFHRIEGSDQAGYKKIEVLIYEGTWNDALQFAAKENAEHLGMHRTHDDKRRAVEFMIEADKNMSNREIAKHVRVSHGFVNTIRRELEPARVDTESTRTPKIPEKAKVPTKEQEETESEPEPPPPPPKPIPPGQEREFRWMDMSNAIGMVVKQFDQIGRVYGCMNCLEHKGLLRKLQEVLKESEEWWKREEKKRRAIKP